MQDFPHRTPIHPKPPARQAPMGLVTAVKTCFGKFVQFKGRASRREFWFFILFILLGTIACMILNSLLFGGEVSLRYQLGPDGQPVGPPTQVQSYNGGVFGTAFGLVVLLPWLAVTWRRMHDSGRPGYLPFLFIPVFVVLVVWTIVSTLGFETAWTRLATIGEVSVPASGGFFALSFVLFFGGCILNLYWLTRPSDPTSNRYGPNPTEVPQ